MEAAPTPAVGALVARRSGQAPAPVTPTFVAAAPAASATSAAVAAATVAAAGAVVAAAAWSAALLTREGWFQVHAIDFGFHPCSRVMLLGSGSTLPLVRCAQCVLA